jgi:hypothetical protein
MGPNKQRLIAAGEKLLDYKWQLIPATAYLEYERTGNRKIMEVPYDANRQALNTLMLAELAEGKGRFIDQPVYDLVRARQFGIRHHDVRSAVYLHLPAGVRGGV